MPPSSGPGTGKKMGGASAMRQQNRSRNTTPSSVPPTASLPNMETIETDLLDLRFELFRDLTYEDIVDSGASAAVIPDSKSLDGMVTRLTKLGDVIERRGLNCDRGMRLLAQQRKTRLDDFAAERGREEEKRQREVDDEERAAKKATKKKRKVVDSLAPQATNTERASPRRDGHSGKPRKVSRDDSASSSLSPVAPRTPSNMDGEDKTKVEDKDEESSSDDDGRPPPPARPQANTFGDDPSTFPDPTVYEVRRPTPGMTEEEIKACYSVSSYPRNDLSQQIAGDPPDKDFSNAKPTNQINFSTFSSYIEPYFRPFTEEDLAFLRERGDRTTPFVMPKRGKKHYTDIWAEEDGAMAIDSSPPAGRDRLPPNQARGSIETMDDEAAETDKHSVGPLLSRLLQLMRPENRALAAEPNALTNGVAGDGTGDDFDFGISFSGSQTQPNGTTNGLSNGTNGTPANADTALPPATHMPESNSEAWKKATHLKLDYAQMDERIRQELRHTGFLPSLPHDPANPNAVAQPDPATAADYDGHYDDEVAARLRLLQDRLREQVLINGARKARLAELVKERMAYQEYQTILEDLDGQVQAAYLKRTRTMGKKPKKARPGNNAVAASAAAANGLARPGIGDMTKTLMERRRRWKDGIGTVFDDENLGKVPRSSDPDSTIFKPADMAELFRREQALWDEEVEDDE